MKAGYGRMLRDPKEVLVALRLLVLAGLAMLGIGEPPKHSFLFWFTTIVYGATNLGYLASRAAHFSSPRRQLWIFVFDVLVVSFLIVVRGSRVPEFILAYFTLVLMAAVVQGLGSAILNALFVCLVYAAITLWGKEPSTLLEFPVMAQFAFFVVISVFMGHVAQVAREESNRRAQVEVVATQLEAAVAERTRDLKASLEELRAARSRLQANDRLATLGMLSAGVAHDIRNPLAALLAVMEEAPGFLDEVESRYGPAEPDGPVAMLRQGNSDAKLACEQLRRLAADLGAMAKTTPADPKSVPCDEALDSVARLLRHRAKDRIAIEVRCEPGLNALADPARLQQALVNLATNGIDAMDGRGGTLALAAEPAAPGRVRFRVEDTGAGMSPEVKAKVFRPFFTTKAGGQGTGLGLHLVQEIAHAHGAVVEFDSEPGVGTRFRLDWPAGAAARADGGPDHDGRTQDPAARRGRRGEHPPGAREDAPVGAV